MVIRPCGNKNIAVTSSKVTFGNWKAHNHEDIFIPKTRIYLKTVIKIKTLMN